MTNIIERGLLMTIGAAALTREMAESVTEQLIQRGQSTTEEGRQAVDDLVERAKDETRQAKGRLDQSLERTFRDLGLVTREELEDIELKLAQVEHRLSLLEEAQSEAAAAGEQESQPKKKKG